MEDFDLKNPPIMEHFRSNKPPIKEHFQLPNILLMIFFKIDYRKATDN